MNSTSRAPFAKLGLSPLRAHSRRQPGLVLMPPEPIELCQGTARLAYANGLAKMGVCSECGQTVSINGMVAVQHTRVDLERLFEEQNDA